MLAKAVRDNPFWFARTVSSQLCAARKGQNTSHHQNLTTATTIKYIRHPASAVLSHHNLVVGETPNNRHPHHHLRRPHHPQLLSHSLWVSRLRTN